MSKKYDDKDKIKEDLLNILVNKYTGRLPQKTKDLFGTKNNIPSWDIYKRMFNVNSVEELLNKINFKIHEEDLKRLRKNNIYYIIPKSEVVKRILNMQSKLDKPLMYDDFRDPKENEIGITYIKKYFGTMNKMKEELGLEIIQEDMTCKHIKDFDIILNELHYICDDVYNNENRKMITIKDIKNKNRLGIRDEPFRKCCSENNTSIREILEDYGFELQKEGNGLVYFFEDKEKTTSQYELNFSNKLRDLGYIFNKDYFRDVRYKEFINDYNDMMNCDYVIHIGNKAIYIELAGMLGGTYETNYKNNKELKSKSKKLYAEKLKQKENMFIQNGLNYFILFPSDLKEDDLDFLIENKLNIQRKDLI